MEYAANYSHKQRAQMHYAVFLERSGVQDSVAQRLAFMAGFHSGREDAADDFKHLAYLWQSRTDPSDEEHKAGEIVEGAVKHVEFWPAFEEQNGLV